MGLCLCEYLIGSAELRKACGNISAKRVFYACGELSVGECACTALAELNVCFGRELSPMPEIGDSPAAVIHISATLQHQRTVAHFRKNESRKHSRRPEAAHGDTSLRGNAACYLWLKGRDINIGAEILQGAYLFLFRSAFKLRPDRRDSLDIVLLACIKRYLVNTRLNGLFYACLFKRRSDYLAAVCSDR